MSSEINLKRLLSMEETRENTSSLLKNSKKVKNITGPVTRAKA